VLFSLSLYWFFMFLRFAVYRLSFQTKNSFFFLMDFYDTNNNSLCVCFFLFVCVFYFFSKRGADIISVDQTVSMDDALKRLKAVNPSILVQGNLDPTVLLSNDKTNIKLRTEEILKMTGGVGHVMNLGHGVESNTSEENVQYFVETVRNWKK
jgi:hypothetical protein